jgi:hypothetical protein
MKVGKPKDAERANGGAKLAWGEFPLGVLLKLCRRLMVRGRLYTMLFTIRNPTGGCLDQFEGAGQWDNADSESMSLKSAT